MRSAGMLRVRAGTICLLVLTIGLACGLPLQFLPSIPGYIPVYIRNGDQPLIEINPALAEAFHETEKYPKTVRNMQLDRIPEETDKTASLKEGKITENKDSEKPSEKVVEEDSQNNDAINKITDPIPKFVNLFEPKENKNENGDSNILKVSKIPETEKNDLKSLAAEIEREETRANGVYDSRSKMFSEPEEVQFIKVSIVSDPLEVPIIRKAKNLQISTDIKEHLKNNKDNTTPGEKHLFDASRDTRLKDLTEKNDDSLTN